jgi:hypothetical protein
MKIFGTNKYITEKYDDKDDLSYLERKKNVQSNTKKKVQRKKDRSKYSK